MTAEVAALQEQYEELQRRIDDLRGFEREYRSRLAAYLTGQLGELREPGWLRVDVGREWTDAGPGIRLRLISFDGVNDTAHSWIEVETR